MAISNDIIDQLIGKAKTEENLFGKEGLLKQLTKQLIERMLESELTHELGYEKHSKNTGSNNARNGTSKKTVKTGNGDIAIAVPVIAMQS